MNVSEFLMPVKDVYLSSAFTNRVKLGEAVFIKHGLSADDAKTLVSVLSKTPPSRKFVNAINPAHVSTAVLARGLTDVPPKQMFISANVGDVIIIMIPNAASRDATEFNVKNFKDCVFEVVQICDRSVLRA